ncbi:MAG: methyl-accepting chemotaxis protein, partial [Lachnospira sp.]|nr:methyl-accepting chemotaxis protein [Lachnospira sp.]
MGVMKNMKNMKITAVIRIAFMLCSLYALGMMVIALAMVSGGVNLSEKSAAATGFQLAFLACVVGSLLTGVIVGNMVVKTIKYSMGQLQQMANALAVGDTSVTFEQTDNNELGAIVREFNSVVGATKKYSEEAYKIAEGDMTVNVEVRSDNDTLGKALKKLVTDNNNTLLGIRESSMQLTSGSGQVASASQALAQGSTEQASAIEQISASMTEIAKDINANAEVTNQSDVVVREMVARATKGNDQMKEMMKAMHAIQT